MFRNTDKAVAYILDGLIITGPTGTNVNDLTVLLTGKSDSEIP